MRRYRGHSLLSLLFIVCLSHLSLSQGAGRDGLNAAEQARRDKEKKIEKRDRDFNGIYVGTPKVYDDSVLQQMLNAAIARLISLQVLDQTGIASHLGSITGANQQISSFGLSVQGPAAPQSVITSNGATKQVVDTVKSPTDNTVVTTANAPVQNVTTTVPQMNVPTATAPSPSTTLPSSFSVSASDILNEQMQLTFEIANLRLLLEGALNDRILKDAKTCKTLEIPDLRPLLEGALDGILKNAQTSNAFEIANLRLFLEGGFGRIVNDATMCRTFVKARTTVGFPITVSADPRFKDAVAMVEVEVETDKDQDLSPNGQAPAVTALLPREKTYNVAAIKERNTSIGAGIATQVVGVAGSFLTGRKTYYLVQDQDTVALMLPPDGNVRRTGFVWQFRPVLGERYVKAGLKQTFVQLSFPSPSDAPSFGKIHVRTYWRKYDRDTGILKGIVKGSLREDSDGSEIPTFDMKQNVSAFGVTNLEDLGNGQMLVSLTGNFLGGTYVRVGSTLLQSGSPGFTSEYSLIRFTAPIADLATKKTVVVTRDGTEVPLLISVPLARGQPIKIIGKEVKTIDEANSLLTVQLNAVQTQPGLPLLLIVGGKAFGYSDAPVVSETDNAGKTSTLSIVLPTAFLISNPEVTVKPILADDRFCGVSANFCDKVKLFSPSAELERLVLLDQSGSRVRYLLFGRKLGEVNPVDPQDVPPSAGQTSGAQGGSGGGSRNQPTPPRIELLDTGSDADKDTIRIVSVDGDFAKNLKQLVFRRANEAPFLVSVPAPPTADQTKSQPKFQERVTVGADDALIVGDDLSKVTQVFFQKTELNKTMEGKALRIKGLAAAGATAVAKTQNIDLKSPTGKTTTIQLEVVNSKIESVQK